MDAQKSDITQPREAAVARPRRDGRFSVSALVAEGLVIDGLSILRGGRLIQAGLSHTMSAGEITLVTGPNGSGKSSLLRVVAGRLQPAAGQLHCTVPILYIGHNDGLAAQRSGRANLGDWARLNGMPADADTLDAALATMDASRFAGLPVRMLSRGQRQRLALARLSLGPQGALWLLDEPNAGLDSTSDALLQACLATHLAAGGMVMAATHLPLVETADVKQLVLEIQP